MALIDKASLLMVPSTYEAGKLYNVLPSGNRAPDSTDQNSGYDQTRADFDFDRGSNAAASRINSFGLIEKYRENLLVQSNQFDTTWGKVNISTTNGQEGYDGTNNAWKIEGTGSAAFSYLLQSESNNIVKTRSVYAKAGSVSYLGIWGSGSNFGYFDLSNGTLDNISGSSAITHSITDVGNGWYRCEFTTTGSTSSFYIVASANANGTSLSTGDYIYIQSAQLESGLVATEVLTSGATTGKAGVLVDLPRINYDANGENGALLLEPSRQNKIQYSEYFGASYWTKSGASVVSGFTSPEGLGNAYKLVEDTSSGTHSFVFPAVSTTSNNTYSIYVKSNGRTKIGFREVQETGYYAAFNLSSNAVIEKSSQVTASIVPLNNGWKRCEINFPVTTSTVMGFYMLSDSYTTGDPLTTTYTGDGSSGVHIFGAQIEAGSYPSSYIPNHGESGGITRAADSCSVTGASDVIGQTEGTLFMDVDLYARDSYSYFALAPNLGSTSVYIGIGITATAFSFEVVNSGVQVAYNYSNSSTGNFKLAFAYKANDFVAYVNGTQVMTDTSGNVPACSQIALNQYDKDQPLLYKQATLFKERLSNAELAALTA